MSPGVEADCVRYDRPISFLVVLGEERIAASNLPSLAQVLAEVQSRIGARLADHLSADKEARMACDFADLLELGQVICSSPLRYGFSDASILPHLAEGRDLVFVTFAFDEDVDLSQVQIVV